MSEKNTDNVEKIWMKRVRNLAGLMGMILPWLSLIGAILVARTQGYPDNFWSLLSISETYYVTPPLVGVLTTAAVVLMCYKGYSTKDHVISALAGLFGLMIVLFPCNCPAAGDIVGFFQLPVKISDIIHCSSAVAFFLLLSYMSLCQFTQGKNDTRNNVQREGFKRLGVLADWEHPYITLDPKYEGCIAHQFAKVVESGALFKAKKPVYWCTSCETALAEAEIEYDNHQSPSIYVKFPLIDKLEELEGEKVSVPGKNSLVHRR